MRPWSTDEVTAVLDDSRMAHWAEDFPADEGRVIAGFIVDRPDALGPYGQRQIIERASGLVIGAIGLFWPPSDGALEIGYGIVVSRRGRGYAPEATRALIAYALNLPDVHTVYADVELSNPASVRVLEKSGLRRWSEDATTARFRTTASEPSQR
ncbi:GNAT family N-acetyltransferase [Streptomyces sp. NPDC086554]|uniref:GNAT family N-acetyltransferase n=1 Tax=Streptomyces sp. NPDC086554 TaxID=3154864 RepID=UPI003433CB25